MVLASSATPSFNRRILSFSKKHFLRRFWFGFRSPYVFQHGLHEFMVILAWCTGIPSIVILSPNIRLWHSTTRDTDTMSRPSAHRLPPERTRTVLISSSCGYDQDNSHKVTNNDLLFVLSSTHPARHSTLDTRLPPRSLNLKTYSIHHSPRLASPRLLAAPSPRRGRTP